jgi:hypothetical protein
MADSAGNLHRLWQPPDDLATVWDQVSRDGGRSWQAAQRLPAEDGPAAVTVDPAGRLQLVGVGLSSLSHWLWDGSRWQADVSHRWTMTGLPEGAADEVAAAVSQEGDLVVVWAAPTGEDNSTESQLLFAARTLALPSGQTALAATPTQPALSPTQPAAAVAVEPTLTPAALANSQPTAALGSRTPEPGNASSSITKYAVALVPVGLVMLVVLGIVAVRVSRNVVR